ncbi:MarR family winged helix-turn-helix transcriptional regulator [Pseudoalteromonas denitrificans]|uniref:DNA-binding transcriptional regulator, MarR family n=1 Tax=Pseudoalteromonas denitrificans DSM 6059 TaxID=1123010 RepID=A0A1I1E9A4_9GAMM|nr:MarR family transcriptional regulator [Pseudoalteromonas denitrificans]SFB83286.1 DNA-binding transcriptional regulator, MarR family [Pseudoalteromonas denitrificans DSM 6059]
MTFKAKHISKSARSQAFTLTEYIEDPLDLTSHLPYRVAVVSNLLALNRDWKIRNLTDLDPREMRVLLNIGSYMPVKSADIAYQSRLDSYTVSRAVKKLLALNLIASRQDEIKKNVKNLYLNDAGKLLYQKLIFAMDERAKELESILSNEEKALFFNMLERIENKTEAILATQASELIKQGLDAPTDQKELIRWHKKTNTN